MRAAAADARLKADHGAAAADVAAAAAVEPRRQAEEAAKAAVKAFGKAERSFEQFKQACKDVGKGMVWLMGREIEEAKKYMTPAELRRLNA